jgi:hypothetical protein
MVVVVAMRGGMVMVTWGDGDGGRSGGDVVLVSLLLPRHGMVMVVVVVLSLLPRHGVVMVVVLWWSQW